MSELAKRVRIIFDPAYPEVAEGILDSMRTAHPFNWRPSHRFSFTRTSFWSGQKPDTLTFNIAAGTEDNFRSFIESQNSRCVPAYVVELTIS